MFTPNILQQKTGDGIVKNNGVVRIRAYYPSFSHGEQRIADYMLDNLSTIQRCTISELSNNCHTSTASISRFVKRIGYSNYRDFLFNLATTDEKENDLMAEIGQKDSTVEIVEKTFNGAINALKSTKQMLSEKRLVQAVNILKHTKKIAFFGLGGSSIVALNGYHKFLRTSIDCEYYPDFDIQLMQAVKMTSDQCAIVVSHSGENRQTVEIATQLRARHVPVIAITSAPDSDLAQTADVTLISVGEQVNKHAESLSSLMAQLTIVDSLFLATATDNSEKTTKVIKDVRQVIDSTRK
ncbi:transcription regulator [Paucilactobacillus suebicus DSM 5007 = KCTC 3549]|uniref:Transcription regulator n=1 Tax=Paucilactobacillus suebicus DSM 5007 = KCTC 3549 TaxID=1423807 RepID=A0A0R1WEM1_9LACO|nr:transcription regulator [Paucilactobacillus suebicus DSM 5007 = KCTC 3549]